MKRIEVESNCIHSIGYDADDMVLEIEFHSGGIYQYTGVPCGTYAKFMSAESHGKAFHALIKGKFPHRKQARELVFATEIWRQIPTRVKMSVAASNPVGDDEPKDYRAYLHFTVNPPTRRGLHKIIIRLTVADLYLVQFVKCDVAKNSHEVLRELDGIFCDQLGEIVEDMVWDDSPVLQFED